MADYTGGWSNIGGNWTWTGSPGENDPQGWTPNTANFYEPGGPGYVAPTDTGGGGIAPPATDPYASVYAQLDQLAGLLPTQKAAAEAQIGQLSGMQAGQVQSDLAHSMSYVPYWQGQVASNQKNTLQALSQDTQDLMRAGNTYLGSRGAGDSSASGQYAYALGKEANKQRANVLNQSNSKYAAINMKAADIQQAASDQISQINQWKSSQLASLTSDFQDRMNQLAMTRANLTTQEANYWMGQLGSIEGQANNWSNAVTQWGNDRANALQGFQTQLNQTAQYTPEKLTYQGLPSISGAATQSVGGSYTPWVAPKKDETNSLFTT